MPTCPLTTLVLFPLAQRCLQKITHCKGSSGEVLGTLQGFVDRKQYPLSSKCHNLLASSTLLCPPLASEVPGRMLGTEQARGVEPKCSFIMTINKTISPVLTLSLEFS